MNISGNAFRDTLQIGQMLFTDLTNLLQLQTTNTGANVYGTFRRAQTFQSSGYVVPASTTLYLYALRIILLTDIPDPTLEFDLGYGDTDVGLSSVAAPTNLVSVQVSNVGNGFTTGMVDIELGGLQVPTAKYPAIKGPALPCYYHLFGYAR